MPTGHRRPEDDVRSPGEDSEHERPRDLDDGVGGDAVITGDTRQSGRVGVAQNQVEIV